MARKKAGRGEKGRGTVEKTNSKKNPFRMEWDVLFLKMKMMYNVTEG